MGYRIAAFIVICHPHDNECTILQREDHPILIEWLEASDQEIMLCYNYDGFFHAVVKRDLFAVQNFSDIEQVGRSKLNLIDIIHGEGGSINTSQPQAADQSGQQNLAATLDDNLCIAIMELNRVFRHDVGEVCNLKDQTVFCLIHIQRIHSRFAVLVPVDVVQLLQLHARGNQAGLVHRNLELAFDRQILSIAHNL